MSKFQKGHIPWSKGKILKPYEPKSCLECGNLIRKNRSRYSLKQWANVKYCGHSCFGKASSVWKKGRKLSYMPKGIFKKGHTINNGSKSPFYKDGRTLGENRKEYYRIKCLERYARKQGAEGTFSVEEWNQLLCRHEYKCVHCGRSDIKITKDHIIPLTRGGSNWIENIQPLCQPCNSSKNNK